MSSIMTTTNEDDVFVYSEMQFNENNQVANAHSKRFVCGMVFEGYKSRPYTKMIRTKDIEAMNAQYPDTKIVAKGSKAKVTYTKPHTELNL